MLEKSKLIWKNECLKPYPNSIIIQELDSVVCIWSSFNLLNKHNIAATKLGQPLLLLVIFFHIIAFDSKQSSCVSWPPSPTFFSFPPLYFFLLFPFQCHHVIYPSCSLIHPSFGQNNDFLEKISRLYTYIIVFLNI